MRWGHPLQRPGEVSRVIDALALRPACKPLLQLDKVGVHGMSAGGVTALVLAGAQWRLLNLVQHCLPPTPGGPSPDPGFCFFGQAEASAQARRAASYERARGAPEAYLPAELKTLDGGRSPEPSAGTRTDTRTDAQPDPRPDPRIAAVTLAVPLAAIFSADSLARIRVPVGVISAGKDRLRLPAGHSARVLRHCIRLTDLPGAGHFDLVAPWPAEVAQSVGARQAQGGYREPGFDARQREAAWSRVAAFYLQHLSP